MLPDEFPDEVLPADELPGGEPLPDELEPEPDDAPPEGDVLELDPDGLLAVLPDDGERGVAVELAPGEEVEPALREEVEPLLLEPFLLEPELSHAPSDTAESSAAAINSRLFIRSFPMA